jgi:hypothetical protein
MLHSKERIYIDENHNAEKTIVIPGVGFVIAALNRPTTAHGGAQARSQKKIKRHLAAEDRIMQYV